MTATRTPMTERQLQRHVEAALRQLGWLSYHTWLSVRSAPGFPDIIAVQEATGRCLAIELKRDGREPTAAQLRWLVAFAGVPGVECYCWHGSDWESGEIARILSGQEAAHG